MVQVHVGAPFQPVLHKRSAPVLQTESGGALPSTGTIYVLNAVKGLTRFKIGDKVLWIDRSIAGTVVERPDQVTLDKLGVSKIKSTDEGLHQEHWVRLDIGDVLLLRHYALKSLSPQNISSDVSLS